MDWWKAAVLLLPFLQAALSANCPPKWASFGESCYLLGDIAYQQEDARALCQQRRADLVSFNSRDERLFIEDLVRFRQGRFWVGMRRKDGVWEWEDGSKPDPEDGDGLIEWREGQPSGNANCASYEFGNFGLIDTYCSNRRYYICKRRYDILDVCDIDSGWHDFDGMCFRYFDDSRSWQDAGKHCEEMSSSLAILNNEAKLDVFKEVVSCKDYDAGVWIGLSDTESDVVNELRWVDDTALGSVTNWDDGQPDFVGGVRDNCVHAFTASSYRWRVATCGTENKYVCEKPQGTCAPGWRDFSTGKCYLMVWGDAGANKRTWTQAADLCAERGAQLIKITSDAEQEALVTMGEEMRKTNNVGFIRIGVSDLVTDNVYRWQDGSPLTYNKFNLTTHEQYPARVDCGYVKTGGNYLWGTTYCFDRRNYICEIPIHTAPRDPVDKPEEWTCPYEEAGNWEVYGSDCYSWQGKSDYPGAVSRCAALGGVVTSIRTPGEMSFVADVQRGRGRVWIGLVYRGGKHVWEDGADVSRA